MRIIALSVLVAAALFADLGGMFTGGMQNPAIQYITRPVSDPVAELSRKIQRGEVHLKFDGSRGYVHSLLEALNIPVESQLAVFSRTSLLAHLIRPNHPRTVFFNDSVILTWIPGEPFVELAAEDPQQGIIFYTLDDKPADKPVITRHNGKCLTCHNSLASLGVPGVMVKSVLASADGTPLSTFGDPDHRTSFAERWGGWYVTGKGLPAGHRGNRRVTKEKSGSDVMTGSSSLESLKGLLDSGDYPTQYSDVVALMVFEHQMHVMNLFTRIGWEARAKLSKPDQMGNELAEYLLFVDEWQLPAPIEGTSGFAEKFSAEGPRDGKGRSLREFDLKHRLMRYPCSYMIYSPAFDALPAEVKSATYKRMWQVLSGNRYPVAERQAVIEILHDTKTESREYFR